MSDNIKKRNIQDLIEKEAPNLNNLLEPEDVSIFKEMTGSCVIPGLKNKCLEHRLKWNFQY